jgi:hypothetical protein
VTAKKSHLEVEGSATAAVLELVTHQEEGRKAVVCVVKRYVQRMVMNLHQLRAQTAWRVSTHEYKVCSSAKQAFRASTLSAQTVLGKSSVQCALFVRAGSAA